MGEIPASTAESIALSKELKRRGFRFVGPTTVYAFMQSAGLVDDHLDGLLVSGCSRTPGVTASARRTFGSEPAHPCHSFRATLPSVRTVTTPWGKATEVEQVSVAQRAGERRFATVVQLLETGDGERLVRFAYTTDGVSRRGPVTLRAKDLERMGKLLERAPGLRKALGT